MQCRIEWSAGFEHAVSDMYELAHHRANDQFGWFVVGRQALMEMATPTCLVECDHRRHIQRLAREGVAYLGQARLAPHATARFMPAWV